MDSANLTDYFSKISDIRTKILSKHKESLEQYPIHQQRELQMKRLPERTYQGSLSKGTFERVALTDKTEPHNINNRVKELDSVNNRIRNMLSSKKKPTNNHNVQIKADSSKIDYLRHNMSQKPPSNNENIQAQKINVKTQKQSLLSKELQRQTALFKLSNQNISHKEEQRSSDIKHNYQLDTSIITKLQEKITSKINQFQDKNTKGAYKIQPMVANKDQVREAQKFIKELGLKILPNEIRMKMNDHLTPVEQKLVAIFLMQVQLDKKLRLSKESFYNLQSKDKRQLLKQILLKMDIKLSGNQLQNWTKFSLQECDPFSDTKQSSKCCLDDFALTIMRSKEHWQRSFKKSIELKELQQQHFSIKSIDSAQKGYISIQDLICYVNMNSKSSLRNRDMLLLFKRLTKSENKKLKNRLQYEDFLNYITV